MEEKLKAKKGMRGTKDTMRREREREGKDKWRFKAGNAKKNLEQLQKKGVCLKLLWLQCAVEVWVP